MMVLGSICSGLVAAQEIIPAAAARAIDDEVGFAILVWQHRTDAIQDAAIYKSVNLRGFHIDRGDGQQSRKNWALRNKWPYYIDHAAGKGTLHLTNRSGLQSIPHDGTPSPRPHSFAESATLQELQRQVNANLPDAISSQTLAVALDDEVSIGTFNSPLELDYSPNSVRRFRSWIRKQYRDPVALHRAWSKAAAEDGVLEPKPFEFIRKEIDAQPPSSWRLAPWMDFRAFNDHVFADTLAKVTRHAITLSDGAPVGVVGAQQPSAYGGFDYSRLRHAVQFMEAYDIGGTNEILHSFWSQTPRKPRMQTYFLSGDPSVDRWFLWYYLVHGNRGVIAWPTVKGKHWFDDGKVHQSVKSLARTFQEVQSPMLSPLAHPNTRSVFDEIAVLISHPSARLGWAIDSTAHGKTWPRRSSSLDNACNSAGKNRVAWTRLIEDLGYQARLVDENDLRGGVLDQHRVRVLVLPQALAIDAATCDAIERFVTQGGVVLADYMPAITDEHGTGYRLSPLARVFGLSDEQARSEHWFDGKRRYEINGERYTKPFAQRISDDGCLMDGGQAIIHREITDTWRAHTYGNGKAVFINQSPTRLFDSETRRGNIGKRWREKLRHILKSSLGNPQVRSDDLETGVELLRYEVNNTNDQIWCWVANPTRQASVDGAGKRASVSHDTISFSVVPSRELRDQIVEVTDLRSGRKVPIKYPLKIQMPGDEAVIYKISFHRSAHSSAED